MDKAYTDGRDSIYREVVLVGLCMRTPTAVGAYLQQEAAYANGDLRNSTSVLSWWSKVSEYELHLPIELHGAVVWALGDRIGLLSAPPSIDADFLKSRLDHVGCLGSACVEAGRLIALRRNATRDDDAVAGGAAAELRDLMGTDPQALIALMPWLLASGTREEVSFLAEFAVTVPEAFRTLRDLAADPDAPARIRTRGLHDILTLGSQSSSGDLARWASDTSTFMVPTKMSAPSSIWTDDSSFENAVRNAMTAATQDLRTKSLPKEDQITGSLVTLLRQRLEKLAQGSAARADHQGLDLTYVTTPSSARSGRAGEVVNGTDLAILISVDVPGVLVTKKAHLVQVKRPPVPKRDTTPPRWDIDTSQLKKILGYDRSATYWLISERPNERVLCLPASYLEARAHARVDDSNYGEDKDKLSLKYDNSLSSASVPLGQLLLDFVIGMWLGTTDPAVVAIAEGRDATYVPEHLLHIHIGTAAAN